MDLSKAIKIGSTIIKKNSPGILIGVGIAGYISSILLTVRATAKIVRNIDAHPEKDKLEILKDNFIDISIPLGTSILSTGALLLSHKESLRRQAVLTALWSVADKELADFRESVKEEIGAKKYDKIQGDVYEKSMNEVESDTPVIISGSKVLCFDVLSGRYFYTDTIETIRRIQNDLNASLISDLYITQNDLYDAFGLEHVKDGDLIGWEANRALIDFKFHSKLTKEGVPCLVIDYRVSPIYISFK